MTALANYRILELAESVSGEYCGKLLADFGAEVIKIERPGIGSPTRHLGPFGEGGDGKRTQRAVRLPQHQQALGGARSGIPPKALTLLRQLVGTVDVVIDDHASGWLAGAGLDPGQLETRWPGLVLCSITAYGQNPPDERKHAEDLTVFHSSGWGFHTPGVGFEDQPPLKGPGRFFSHYEAGQEAAMYITGCLIDREDGGRGRFIDVSMHEVMVSRADYVVAQFVAGEMDVTDWRGGFDMHGPGGIFPCKDGFIYVFMATPDQWAAYRKMVGDPEWARDLPPDWLMKGLTPERIALVRRDLCEWLKTRGKVEAAHRGAGAWHNPGAGELAQRCPGLAAIPAPALFRRSDPSGAGHGEIPDGSLQAERDPRRDHLPRAAAWGRQRTLSDRVGPADMAKLKRGGPLQGVRVVELSKIWAGPETGKQFAFMGAEVIKIETKDALDFTRFDTLTGDINKARGFMSVNPQKLSAQIDIKTKEGVDLVLDLLRHCDILVDNLRPGAMERLGLGWDAVRAVNPRMVQITMGMYGNDGPLAYQIGLCAVFLRDRGAQRAGRLQGPAAHGHQHALWRFHLWHRRRLRRTCGFAACPPHRGGPVRRCLGGGMHDDHDRRCDDGLHPQRRRAGLRRHAACRNGAARGLSLQGRRMDQHCRVQRGGLDGAGGSDGTGRGPRFATLAARKANEDALDRLVSDWTTQHDVGDLVRQLAEQGRGCGQELHVDGSHRRCSSSGSAGSFLKRRSPTAPSGRLSAPAPGSRGQRRFATMPPGSGADTDYVLGELLGLSAEEQAKLKEAGITC